MSAELRLGLIGCGRLAERGYAPALRKARGMRLAAVADPVGSRCATVAPDLPAFRSAGELVAGTGVDAVILANPARAHLADARTAAAAGLPALVEKPPAEDAGQATTMAALEPAPRLGFNRRFDPALARLRRRVPAGELDVTVELHHRGGSWGAYEVADDALLTLGPHLLDLVRWLGGCDIAAVRADRLTPAEAGLDLSLERGVARLSCATAQAPSDRIVISGRDGGSARYEGAGLGRRLVRRLARPATPSLLVHLLVRELEAFGEAVRGRPAPQLATAADGVAVMAAIDAARRSAASGGGWEPSSVVAG